MAALSGRHEALELLQPVLSARATDEVLVAGVREFVRDDTFFRGGQAHGRLRKEDVPAALAKFLAVHHMETTAHAFLGGGGPDRGERRREYGGYLFRFSLM